MFHVYVLYSPLFNKIYIGFTSNLSQRLLSHNTLAKKGWTVRFRPWDVIFTESFDNKKDALFREKQLKGAACRAMIWNLIAEKYNLH